MGCRRLEEYVGILPALEGRREGVCGLIEGLSRYYRGRERRGFVEVLQKGPAERDDGVCRIDGYSREQREVLAAVYVGAEMRSGRVSEKDEREGGDMSG